MASEGGTGEPVKFGFKLSPALWFFASALTAESDVVLQAGQTYQEAVGIRSARFWGKVCSGVMA